MDGGPFSLTWSSRGVTTTFLCRASPSLAGVMAVSAAASTPVPAPSTAVPSSSRRGLLHVPSIAFRMRPCLILRPTGLWAWCGLASPFSSSPCHSCLRSCSLAMWSSHVLFRLPLSPLPDYSSSPAHFRVSLASPSGHPPTPKSVLSLGRLEVPCGPSLLLLMALPPSTPPKGDSAPQLFAE